MISLIVMHGSTRTLLTPLLSGLLIFSVTSCAKRSRATAPGTEPPSVTAGHNNAATTRINLNTASVKDLETLPGIGKGLAERIVEHREKYGAFRRAEHLMMVRGISDARFRALRHLITLE